MLHISVIVLCLSYTVGDYLQLGEGSSCTWKGIEGKCVNFHKCLSAIFDVKNKDHPPICSYIENTPIICCTDCTLVNDTRLVVIDTSLGILTKTGNSIAKDKCIDYLYNLPPDLFKCKERQKRIRYFKKTLNVEKKCHEVSTRWNSSTPLIIGGKAAEKDEFPHMALLGYGKTYETAKWLCGGSVISESYILTAAHCLSSPSTGPVKYIALGVLKRTDPVNRLDLYYVRKGKAISHPGYMPPSKYHDIALLKTHRPSIRPACLHTDDEMYSQAIATGWGALGYKKELSDVLQSVTLNHFSKEECSDHYGTHRLLRNGFDESTQMCYGDRNVTDIPTDTCEGDSGGPLQSYDHEQCMSTIIGVTSFGRQCGMSAGSGIYTRVSYYIPWIESIVWPSNETQRTKK